MLVRTHIAINLFVGLLFINLIYEKTIFLTVLLIATLLPDVDNAHSYISHKIGPLKRIFLFFSEHRGFFHSLTYCMILTSILLVFFPLIALPFFMGYSIHLLADSFTIQGVRAFWPHVIHTKGRISVGGLAEKIVLTTFVLLDLLIIIVINIR